MEQRGRDPTIMYLLRALKYQLLSSSKMEESMQQYSHKFEVLHSGQKPFKNEKKKPEFLPQCFKITEKVSFNIVSEASYVSTLSGQKFIKNAKNGQF